MSADGKIFSVDYLFDGDKRLLRDCEVFVEEGRIRALLEKSETGQRAENIRRDFSEAETISLPGTILLPGLINSHHHFYSALVRGLSFWLSSQDFPTILKELWWKYDRLLDLEILSHAAQAAALDCIRSGCTTVIDHHSSPNAICGSLKTIADAADRFNLATVLCYEISDRDGKEAAAQAVEENLSYVESSQGSLLHRGMMGLHASFTLNADTLEKIAAVKTAPIHIHAAEDRCDVDHAQAQGFSGPLARLNSFGLLDERSLIVHGIHLSEEERRMAADLGLRIALNPESNCNNKVGLAYPFAFRPNSLLLGTDGMTSNMLQSLRSAYFIYSNFQNGKIPLTNLLENMLFQNPSVYLSELFGRSIGRIVEGEPADFAVFRYNPSTPLTADNLMAHLIFGLSSAAEAVWVYAHGRPVLADGRVTVADEAEIRLGARQAAARLWEKFSI